MLGVFLSLAHIFVPARQHHGNFRYTKKAEEMKAVSLSSAMETVEKVSGGVKLS